jgi:hypothetical protein
LYECWGVSSNGKDGKGWGEERGTHREHLIIGFVKIRVRIKIVQAFYIYKHKKLVTVFGRFLFVCLF